jgi:signal transduction histidine kinase
MQSCDVSKVSPHRGARRCNTFKTMSEEPRELKVDAAADGQGDRLLRASEERFRAFVVATSDVVYSASADWREMRYLAGKVFIADTFGPSRVWLERYIPSDDQKQVRVAIEAAIRARSTFELEHRVIRADGTIGWTFSRAIPLLNDKGEIIEWFGAARDVTESKRREEAFREMDQRKDDFIAMLSHELRNPLAAMVNAVHLLQKARTDDPLQEKAREIIQRQLAVFRRLVDDLLEIGRITSGRLRLRIERVDLGAIVERAVETARPLIESRGQILAVKQAEPIVLDADPARLQQVFVNLLNNAAKYTDMGGRIDLTVRLEQGQAVVSVADTGIGIEPELLPQLFQPFTQAKRSLTRSDGGLGLGLSIVRHLVDMHSGAVEARSTVGQGSEFTVRLPLSASAG